MEKLINDFLDKTVGHDIVCTFHGTWGDNHYSISTKDFDIVIFKVYGPPNKTKVKTKVPQEICRMVSSFFGIQLYDAHICIRHWFWNRYEISHEDEFLKFISKDSNDNPFDFTYY